MKRRLRDIVISSAKSFCYSSTEPFKLIINRFLFGRQYFDKEENPLVTVYCPTYNRAELLMERAVKSVLSQSYKNFEFIIVGDCCTDDTQKLVSAIPDLRVRFYNLPKKSAGYPLNAEGRWFAGPVKAANQALRMVKGKWIARIDDDDIWTKDHIEVSLKFAQENDCEFVSAAYIEERYGKRRIENAKNDNPRIGGTQTWLYRSYLKFFKYNIDCWRKSWNRVNDIDISKRMFYAGVKMRFFDRVTGYILPRPGEKTIGIDAYKEAETEGFKNYYGENKQKGESK